MTNFTRIAKHLSLMFKDFNLKGSFLWQTRKLIFLPKPRLTKLNLTFDDQLEILEDNLMPFLSLLLYFLPLSTD